MKSFFKKHILWCGNYVTELSVVVISIAITFYGEDRIEQHNERQKDRQVMQMMLNELSENAQELQCLQKRCANDVVFSTLLRRYLDSGELCSLDTLALYSRYHYLYPQWIFKRNAFDVMKTSGVMQRIEDEELMMSIFDCYDQIDIVKQMGDRFRDERFSMIMKYVSVVADNGETSTIKQWQQIKLHAPFCDYLHFRFRYTALNVQSFGARAYEAVYTVIVKIEAFYGLQPQAQ